MIKDVPRKPCYNVRECNKLSLARWKRTGKVTDGELVGIFRETAQSSYDGCPDKRVFFDLPISEEFDHGQVVIISENKHPIEPKIKIYGIPDRGIRKRKSHIHPAIIFFFFTSWKGGSGGSTPCVLKSYY